MNATFPFALLLAILFWFLPRASRRARPGPVVVRTPTSERIARVRKLVEDGCLAEAMDEGRAWIRQAEAGEALFGPAVAECLAAVLDAQLQRLPTSAEAATSFGETLLAALRARAATGSVPRMRTLLALGHLARASGDPARAAQRYDEAVEIAGRLERLGKSDLVFLLLCAAGACRECRSFDEAARHLEHALAVHDGIPGGGRQLLDILSLTGWVRLEKGELTLARRALERAFDVAAMTCTEADLVQAGIGECMGRVLLAQGDAAAAVSALRKTAELEERVLGADSPALVSTLFFLSKAFTESGALPDAVAALERARAIQERAVCGHSSIRREIVAALARLKFEQGEIETSLALFREMVEAEESAEPGRAAAVPLLLNLAGVCRSIRDVAGERRHLERALALAERVHGKDAAELMRILEPLGLVVWNSSDWATAREINGRLAQIQRKQLGPDHPALARTLFNQAIVTARTGEHGEAQRLFSDTMDVLSETPFCPPGTFGEIVARLEQFQGHPVFGGGYRDLLTRARALRKDSSGGLPLAQA